MSENTKQLHLFKAISKDVPYSKESKLQSQGISIEIESPRDTKKSKVD